MKNALLGPWLAFDTETTGKDPTEARVVQSSTVDIVPGESVTPHTMLVNPGIEIPAEAIAVHGITNEQVAAEGKPAVDAIDQLTEQLVIAAQRGVPLLAQNAQYDFTVLDRECRRLSLPTFIDRLEGAPFVVVDPLVIDRFCIRYRKRVSETQGARTLRTLCAVYDVPFDDDLAHDAEYDAILAARVAWRMGQWSQLPYEKLAAKYIGPFDPPSRIKTIDVYRFRDLGRMSPLQLHSAQIRWYREQTEGLVDYWRQKADELRRQAASTNDDEARASVLEQAAELAERADSATYDWPIRAYTPADIRHGALL